MTHIRTKVRNVIADLLDVEPEKMSDSANLIDDLGADSLDNVVLLQSRRARVVTIDPGNGDAA